MKHTFGPKRKARKILLHEEEDEDAGNLATVGTSSSSHVNRKPFKKSSLRKKITFSDGDEKKEEDFTNIVRRPTAVHSSLVKKKSVVHSDSKGSEETAAQGGAISLIDEECESVKISTQKRRGSDRVTIRKNPLHLTSPRQIRLDNSDRPSYSKEDLNELKNSTPILPQNLKASQITDDFEDSLDISEFEQATIVETEIVPAIVPSEAEIREKKERRARLAQEKDFISFNEEPGETRWVSLLPQKKKTESRLVREDEDFGEGFDEFVDDGQISLTVKQERKARRRQRKEIADMIEQAQANSDVSSEDSEAERVAAYETTQTRAGMDGLHKPNEDEDDGFTSQIPTRITPLPIISECLGRLQNTLNSMEAELIRRQKKLLDHEQEKLNIFKRQEEVQSLLTQAGEKLRALNPESVSTASEAPESKGLLTDATSSTMAERGLENFRSDPAT
ncbi:hypothetical protein K3495_g11558 [Podosphaera aphanis]|nr:hypothetical protein K3495_g11558 [Podosphaera aphanis]